MSEADSENSEQDKELSYVISLIPGNLAVSRSDDGQYLLLYAGQTLLAIYGAMGADPEFVEFADGGRFAVDELLDMVGGT
ncbi:MAG: hypothetical protein ABIK82_00665 [Pseudomonadota bacterium]